MSLNNWPDRLARWSSIMLTVTVIFGIASGAVIAIIWRREVSWETYQLPGTVALFGYLLAALLSLPSFVAGLWNVLRGRWQIGLRRMVYLLGAVLVFLGAELGSHYLVPCDLVNALGWGTPDWGLPPDYAHYACEPLVAPSLTNNVYARGHLLHHTLLGGLPLLVVYGFVLRRWRMAQPASTI